LKSSKRAKKDKPKDPKGNVPKADNEVNYNCGGPNSYESKRKQKLTAWEVRVVGSITTV
jgi:hypothetical protein